MMRLSPSTVAERSPHVLVDALEDPEDREWVTLTCSCEWSARVREEGAMAAFLDHASPSNACADSGSFSPTTESGGRAALTAGPLDDDLHGGVASA